MATFMAALKAVDTKKRTLDAKRSGGKIRAERGIPFDQIFAQIQQVARTYGESAPLRSEVETTAAEALRVGFVTVVPSGSASPALLYASTDDYYDLALFMATVRGFDYMLETARQDERFDDLFKEVDATES
jgi:hypothetical protein